MRHAREALAASILSLAWSSLAVAQSTAPPSDNPAPAASHGGYTWFWVIGLIVGIALIALIWRGLSRRRATRS